MWHTSLDSSLLQHFQFYLWIKKKTYRSFSRSKEKRSRHFLILYENHIMSSSSQEDELLSIVGHFWNSIAKDTLLFNTNE